MLNLIAEQEKHKKMMAVMCHDMVPENLINAEDVIWNHLECQK
jgi:hypothetical protein